METNPYESPEVADGGVGPTDVGERPGASPLVRVVMGALYGLLVGAISGAVSAGALTLMIGLAAYLSGILGPSADEQGSFLFLFIPGAFLGAFFGSVSGFVVGPIVGLVSLLKSDAVHRRFTLLSAVCCCLPAALLGLLGGTLFGNVLDGWESEWGPIFGGGVGVFLGGGGGLVGGWLLGRVMLRMAGSRTIGSTVVAMDA